MLSCCRVTNEITNHAELFDRAMKVEHNRDERTQNFVRGSLKLGKLALVSKADPIVSAYLSDHQLGVGTARRMFLAL